MKHPIVKAFAAYHKEINRQAKTRPHRPRPTRRSMTARIVDLVKALRELWSYRGTPEMLSKLREDRIKICTALHAVAPELTPVLFKPCGTHCGDLLLAIERGNFCTECRRSAAL